MKATDIYLVTNGDEKKAYTNPEDAIASLETEDGEWKAILPRLVPRGTVPVTSTTAEFLLQLLYIEGYLDFAGNTGTVINKITLHG